MDTEEMKQLIRDTLNSTLDERDRVRTDRIPSEVHSEDHIWTQRKRAEEKTSFERWEKIRTNTIGALILMILGGIGSGLWFLWKLYIDSIVKHQ